MFPDETWVCVRRESSARLLASSSWVSRRLPVFPGVLGLEYPWITSRRLKPHSFYGCRQPWRSRLVLRPCFWKQKPCCLKTALPVTGWESRAAPRGRGSVPPGLLSALHALSLGLCPPGASSCAPWTPLRAPCLEPWAVPPRSLGLCPLDSPPCSIPGNLACAAQWLCSQVSSLLPLQGWNRGCVFINGRNLGRYWNIGPQEALYLPGSWLQPGTNEVGGPSPPFGLRYALTPGLLILRGAHPCFCRPACPSRSSCSRRRRAAQASTAQTSAGGRGRARRWAGPGPDGVCTARVHPRVHFQAEDCMQNITQHCLQ